MKYLHSLSSKLLSQYGSAVLVSCMGLSVLLPVGITPAAAEENTCVCDCVYVRSEKIRNPKQFQTSSASCNLIEGKACIGEHRGEHFRGKIHDCEAGPQEAVFSFQSIAAQSAAGTNRELASIIRKATKN